MYKKPFEKAEFVSSLISIHSEKSLKLWKVDLFKNKSESWKNTPNDLFLEKSSKILVEFFRGNLMKTH